MTRLNGTFEKYSPERSDQQAAYVLFQLAITEIILMIWHQNEINPLEASTRVALTQNKNSQETVS